MRLISCLLAWWCKSAGQLCTSNGDRSTRRLSGVADDDEKITRGVRPNLGLNNKTCADSPGWDVYAFIARRLQKFGAFTKQGHPDVGRI